MNLIKSEEKPVNQINSSRSNAIADNLADKQVILFITLNIKILILINEINNIKIEL